jgi:tRNA G10  N-methylase Trm11
MTAIISGRLKNREKSGFERTPPNHAAAIAANLLAFPPLASGTSVAIYDPTCGAGDLLVPYRTLRGAQLFGVEISAERAAQARAALPQAQIIESDVASVSVRNGGMSLIVANPPYLGRSTLNGGRRLGLKKNADQGTLFGYSQPKEVCAGSANDMVPEYGVFDKGRNGIGQHPHP